MSFSFTSDGDWSKTEQFLRKMQQLQVDSVVAAAAQRGVVALQRATPKDTGLAAGSWGYTIEKTRGSITINWTNTDVENGFPVALMIQYGHGTGTGGYVQGQDFVNPAMKPVFDEIAETVWKAVTSA